MKSADHVELCPIILTFVVLLPSSHAKIIPNYHYNLHLPEAVNAVFEILHLICVLHDNAKQVVILMYTKQFVS